MQLDMFSLSGFRLLFVFGLLTISASGHSSELPSKSASGANEVVMGKIEYELPHQLGIMTLQVPLHWVGARAEGIEAGWIDQDGSPFKDNVIFSIRDRDKVTNPDAYLDAYIEAIIKKVPHSTVSDVEKTQARRSFSFERSAEGQEIRQTILVIYTESNDKSYLLTLTLSRPVGAEPVDLDQAKID